MAFPYSLTNSFSTATTAAWAPTTATGPATWNCGATAASVNNEKTQGKSAQKKTTALSLALTGKEKETRNGLKGAFEFAMIVITHETSYKDRIFAQRQNRVSAIRNVASIPLNIYAMGDSNKENAAEMFEPLAAMLPDGAIDRYNGEVDALVQQTIKQIDEIGLNIKNKQAIVAIYKQFQDQLTLLLKGAMQSAFSG